MVIRRIPEDFVVNETLVSGVADLISELPGPGLSFAAFLVTKTSLTTPEAGARLARAIGLKPSEVTWAGLKDKHAITTQHMTARVASDPLRLPRSIEQPGLNAVLVGWSRTPADASWIGENRFKITIRSLDAHDIQRFNAGIDRLRSGGPAGPIRFVNYFGEQRFGSARHGEGFAARPLITGDFEGALKLLVATPARKDTGDRRLATRFLAQKWGRWAEILADLPRTPERRAIEILAKTRNGRAAFDALPNLNKVMCVEAYQSHLWNRIAARTAGVPEPASADQDAPESPPQPASIAPELIGLDLPTPGPEATFHPLSEPHARTILAEEGITLDQLRVPGLRRPAFGAALRPLIAEARALTLSAPEPDTLARPASSKALLLRVEFSLPRGSYATVLLKAIES